MPTPVVGVFGVRQHWLRIAPKVDRCGRRLRDRVEHGLLMANEGKVRHQGIKRTPKRRVFWQMVQLGSLPPWTCTAGREMSMTS